MLIAMTRALSPAFERCELTHVERQPIDLDRAREQHREYERILQECGCRLERLPAEPSLPDSVFVEDAAVVLDEMAVITRPGAVSRRGETTSVARALERYRRLTAIEAPGVLDGGDVLVIDRRIYVGRSSRTNAEGIEQMRELVSPAGYSVTAVSFEGCLHLKSAATCVGAGRVLVNPSWVSAEVFDGLEVFSVDPAEAAAANALAVGARVVIASQYPRTAAWLRVAGLQVEEVDVSELIKAEAGVTCCSLLFRGPSKPENERDRAHTR